MALYFYVFSEAMSLAASHLRNYGTNAFAMEPEHFAMLYKRHPGKGRNVFICTIRTCAYEYSVQGGPKRALDLLKSNSKVKSRVSTDIEEFPDQKNQGQAQDSKVNELLGMCLAGLSIGKADELLGMYLVGLSVRKAQRLQDHLTHQLQPYNKSKIYWLRTVFSITSMHVYSDLARSFNSIILSDLLAFSDGLTSSQHVFFLLLCQVGNQKLIILDCSLKNREPDVRLSWFLDPGGWSKTAVVGLYFIFPGICTLSLDCSLKIREPEVPALFWFLDPGGWSKTAAVGLYFIFPGICTLSLKTGTRSNSPQKNDPTNLSQQ
ncbi:hypothetical protein STEG23_007526, partial [Scotinomys teguina]